MVLKLRDAILAAGGDERPLTEEELCDLARGVDLETLDLAGYGSSQKTCYARNTVLVNEHLELVVICWEGGQASSIHDHGKSLCLYLVTGGTMKEEVFALDGNGEPRLADVRRWRRGQITLARGETIHRVSNPTSGGLVTLHVYSPPLRDLVTHFTPVPTYEG